MALAPSPRGKCITYTKVNPILYACLLDYLTDGILLDPPTHCTYRFDPNDKYALEEVMHKRAREAWKQRRNRHEVTKREGGVPEIPWSLQANLQTSLCNLLDIPAGPGALATWTTSLANLLVTPDPAPEPTDCPGPSGLPARMRKGHNGPMYRSHLLTSSCLGLYIPPPLFHSRVS